MMRDKVGLTFMFAMPILLVVVMTAIQNNTFDLVNKNKLPLLVSNQRYGKAERRAVTGYRSGRVVQTAAGGNGSK